MKLTNDVINQAAAELLGYCDGLNLNNLTEKGYCKACGKGVLDDTHDVPDFIHDANAVRELVVWLIGTENAKSNDDFHEFLDRETAVISPLFTIWLPPKHITLAVLYAAGTITLEQAREAMIDEL